MTDAVPAVYERLDERFGAVRGDSRLERLWTGGRWTEGPLYVPAGRYLLFSDIPNDRVLRWDETDGSVSVFDAPAGYANGRTIDRQGRVVTCQQGPRRMVRTEHDGSTTVLADRWDGRRLNSPNDVVVSPDGAVWFTDPPYGITSDYEGERAEPEIDGCHVYRVDPGTGVVAAVATDLERPNGLAFSVDGRRLYIADTQRRHLRAFGVDGGRLVGGEVFAELDGGPDGVRVDTAGRVWVAAGEALHVLDPDGTLLGRLHLPEEVSNLAFGGPKRNRLFVTASTSVYSILLAVNGAPLL
ncbi:SMP-30/gluconolactonase/LRE family protein [Krasilnikoviella flava]|uniref:Gluconolactonase n=1 Tax=Krasilnikoviella flava TaxID=526729 RepID=A0A1T5L9T5_9MICO|nr:SMP-30/gluconolactonase/LRE family protein [Krasilnikoviella flava]SKC72710.1 gluconolactonase [Krasilnikoviella flava]